MTLQNLYSLQIIFRLLRMVLAVFAAVDGVIVVIGSINLEFNRDLLIYAVWTALWIVLIIPLTKAMRIVSEKISHYEAQ